MEGLALPFCVAFVLLQGERWRGVGSSFFRKHVYMQVEEPYVGFHPTPHKGRRSATSIYALVAGAPNACFG